MGSCLKLLPPSILENISQCLKFPTQEWSLEKNLWIPSLACQGPSSEFWFLSEDVSLHNNSQGESPSMSKKSQCAQMDHDINSLQQRKHLQWQSTAICPRDTRARCMILAVAIRSVISAPGVGRGGGIYAFLWMECRISFLALKSFRQLIQLSTAKPCALLLEAILASVQWTELIRAEGKRQDLWGEELRASFFSATEMLYRSLSSPVCSPLPTWGSNIVIVLTNDHKLSCKVSY